MLEHASNPALCLVCLVCHQWHHPDPLPSLPPRPPSSRSVPGHRDLHGLGTSRPAGLRRQTLLLLLLLALDLRRRHLLLDIQTWRIQGQHFCKVLTHTQTLLKGQSRVFFFNLWSKGDKKRCSSKTKRQKKNLGVFMMSHWRRSVAQWVRCPPFYRSYRIENKIIMKYLNKKKLSVGIDQREI